MFPPGDDLHLTRLLAAGDRQAWACFVRSFHGLIAARVRRTLQECQQIVDPADVEDLCAEVYASLIANQYAALRRFQGRSSLATWLAVVARRVTLRHLRRRTPDRGKGRAQQSSTATETRLPDENDTLEQLILREDVQRLQEVLGQLKPEDRMILWLFYGEGLSYQQISQRLEISINTVGPKLHRAQQRLRRRLASRPGTLTRRTAGGRMSFR